MGGLKRKSSLHLEPPVIRRLVERLAILRAGDLIGHSEQRRRNVADDRAGVVVIQKIADRHRQRKIVPMAGSQPPEEISHPPARSGGRRESTTTALSASAATTRTWPRIGFGAFVFRPKSASLPDSQIHPALPRSPSHLAL